ncbi:MAG TPA: hypothetical protein VF546_15075 [Pyrinomonadaceae bacterium]|jgi:hypothetical protein
MSKFNPNEATFEDGVKRIQEALKVSGLNVGKKIVTSQDKEMVKVVNLLATDNVPKGFKKWQLPFVFDRSQLFISVGNPDVKVDEHSHDEGDGIRFIMSGSIYYGKTELKAGDWMYIPKGTKYSFTVGPVGTLMCYCYECCCVPRRLNEKGWVINPDPFASAQKKPS